MFQSRLFDDVALIFALHQRLRKLLLHCFAAVTPKKGGRKNSHACKSKSTRHEWQESIRGVDERLAAFYCRCLIPTRRTVNISTALLNSITIACCSSNSRTITIDHRPLCVCLNSALDQTSLTDIAEHSFEAIMSAADTSAEDSIIVQDWAYLVSDDLANRERDNSFPCRHSEFFTYACKHKSKFCPIGGPRGCATTHESLPLGCNVRLTNDVYTMNWCCDPGCCQREIREHFGAVDRAIKDLNRHVGLRRYRWIRRLGASNSGLLRMATY